MRHIFLILMFFVVNEIYAQQDPIYSINFVIKLILIQEIVNF